MRHAEDRADRPPEITRDAELYMTHAYAMKTQEVAIQELATVRKKFSTFTVSDWY